jgi:hypothetical protein
MTTEGNSNSFFTGLESVVPDWSRRAGVWHSDADIEKLTKLREPFPPEAVGLLPATAKRPALSYVGHAMVTMRLLEIDPAWTWEPMATDDSGHPVYDRNEHGDIIGLWIELTVCGVTRPGYGSVDPGAVDAVKQLIGDALRNAAMRFGVALDLWAKEEVSTTLVGPPEDPITEDEQKAVRRIIDRQSEEVQDSLREWWGQAQQAGQMKPLRLLTPTMRERVMSKIRELGGDPHDSAEIPVPTGEQKQPGEDCEAVGHSWTLNEDMTQRICTACGEVENVLKEVPDV